MSGVKGQKLKKAKEDYQKYPEYYKKRFPELTEDECIEKANNFKKSINWQCIEYYELKYPNLSHEEHVKLKLEAISKKQKNNPAKIYYWQSRYPELSIEELQEKMSIYNKERNKQCIEYYNKNYPELTDIEKETLRKEFINEYISKIDLSGEKNGMHRSKTTELKRKQISPKCIEFYELKYPELSHEEHKNLLKEHYKLVTKTLTPKKLSTRIEYYLNKGMSKEEAKNALQNRQATFTLEKCIKKYGEIEGVKIFSNRQQKWLKSLYTNFQSNGDGRSKQSKFANDIINKCCKILNINKPKHEKYIYNSELKCAYAYDFIYENKIIEFQGDYWHCNPKLYDENFINKVKHKTAKEIWEYDYNKKILAEKYNYKILYIWEYDYNENPEKEIQKCINFLNENIN